jgi:ABC-2 type transport system permease protein
LTEGGSKQLATSIVTGSQLREDMEKGVLDRFRSLPIARSAPLAGALLTGTLRYAIGTGMTLLVGFAIGWRPEGGWWLVLAGLLVIVTSWAVSWIWALLGVVLRSAGAVQGIGIMILFPLTFLSNAFVPVDTLPRWLAWFANVNPISHLVTAVRELTNDGVVGADVGWTLVGAAVSSPSSRP